MRNFLIAMALLLIGCSCMAANAIKIELTTFTADVGRALEKEKARMDEVVALVPKTYQKEDFAVFKEDQMWVTKDTTVKKDADGYNLIVEGEEIADSRVNSIYMLKKGDVVSEVPSNVKNFMIVIFCEGKLMLVSPLDKAYTILDPKAKP